MTFARRAGIRPPRGLQRPPGSKSLYVIPLVLALIAAACCYLWTDMATRPILAHYRAAGARDDVNCLRLVVGMDVSGSMANFAVPRDDALQQLFGWLKTNLRPDDQVAVIDFGAVANIRMWPTTVAGLGSLPAPIGAKDGVYTYFNPVLQDIDRFPPSSCDTALVLISDAQLIDLPTTTTQGRQLLLRHHVDRIRLLVPGAAIQVGANWAKGFPSAVPTVFDGLDARATGLALGHTVVGLTGQSLAPIS